MNSKLKNEKLIINRNKIKENLFKSIVYAFSVVSSCIIVLVFVYILIESKLFFETVSIKEIFFETVWAPMADNPKYSMVPMILGTLYISFLSVIISVPIGIGCALFLSFSMKKKYSQIILSFIDILAGVPSVIFGFLGLVILVKFLEKNLNLATGESVLAGGILLAIMLLPYIVTGCYESFEKSKTKYFHASYSLGVSRWYTIRKIIIPSCIKSIFVDSMLAFSRGVGETMAVMMVIGNSPILPKLLKRAQTIPSLIALEMGTAEYKSVHYSSLYAAGFILITIVMTIQIIANKINHNNKNKVS